MSNIVLDAIHERRAIRSFSPEMPPREDVERVVDAGLWAASGMGKQSPIIVAITERGLRDRIAAMNAAIMGAPEGTDPFYGAPVILAVLARRDVSTHVCDGSLAIGNMMLAATSLGLGSIWIHRAKEEFEEPRYKELLASLGVQGDYEGIGHVVIGYPDAEKAQPARKDGRVFWAE